ncbi:hypothetical protein PV327_005018 [Microctonus hyperodae]|uniref:Uncharacterized protein n=1 Tax=Microctonus hyperodae TaxID=165561 RepID=A0AA39KN43_MICHY|nr:hypothetical protein PV327_005018 [Microctonus hyperodae]
MTSEGQFGRCERLVDCTQNEIAPNAASTKPLSLVWSENQYHEKNFSIVPTEYVFVKRSNDSKYRNVHSNEKIKSGEEVKVLMGMTNKTMTFVMFGDSYEKLNDVAKFPPKRETAKIKVVPDSSNTAKRKKQNKENLFKNVNSVGP